jgi:Putative Flp pilus-assembly TadE/G-like
MKKKETSPFLSKLVKLVRDEKGQIILMFTIMVPVIMGVVGLSLEVGRVYLLHSQLQDLADAAALAGVKQFDGLAGARDRAKVAAGAVDNPHWWSNTVIGPRLADDGFFFYSRLNPDLEATSDTDAFYMKVRTNFGGISPAFLIAVGAVNINQTRATATAAYLPIVCNVQPLMMCNPLEPDGKNFYQAFTEGIDVKRGMEFHMKVKGSATSGGDGNSWAPGDFGLLDPPGLNSSGANVIRNLLSSQTPEFCYANNLSPRTGNAVQKSSDGLNVRFDMPVNGNQTGLDTTTAPNIIRGLYQDRCTGNPRYQATSFTPPPTPTVPLPEDSSLTIIGNMFKGNGTLNVTAADNYWNIHYGTNWPSDLLAAGQPNRYLAYRRELGLDGQTAPTLLPNMERRDPFCKAPSTNPEQRDKRRIINVAIVDCIAQNVHGNSPVALRPSAYAKMFLFRPSWDYSTMNANSGDVFVELTDVIPIDHTERADVHWTLILVRDHCDPTTMLGCP